MWLKTHKPVADNAVVNRDSSQESNNKCNDSYCNSHNNTCADSSICDEGGLYIICIEMYKWHFTHVVSG